MQSKNSRMKLQLKKSLLQSIIIYKMINKNCAKLKKIALLIYMN